MRIANIIFIIIFTGSVFITSGKFVDEMNTPKYYFVVIALLVIAAFIAISQNRLNFCATKNKMALWGINIICLLQACYGLCQYANWIPSNHSKFAITGSFDNPAGFAAVLSLGFPIGLFLLAKAKKVEWYLSVAGLIVIATAIFLSGSRAGVLAIAISSGAFLLLKTNLLSKLQPYRYYKLLLVFIFGLFIGGTMILYYQKKDSANGRLLIWKVSSEMIKDKPVFGHGYRAFKAKYMDYQAEYFKNNPNSKFELLADNVKHPFNEIIKIIVEFGIVGLVAILSIILFILWKIMKSKNEYNRLVLSGLASFLVFACFSYPLQYVAVWLLLAFYLSILLPSKEIVIKDTPILIFARSVIAIACTFLVVHTFGQISAEIKWKKIAMSSLRCDTEEMLPEYRKLYSAFLKRNPFFLYNYGAELNVAGEYSGSIDILSECKKQFNDYDLQMLLANNYYKKGETNKAVQTYQHASNMIPCRFLPIYQLFQIYRKEDQREMAMMYALEIVNKQVKIPSSVVTSIISEARNYLNENEISYNIKDEIIRQYWLPCSIHVYKKI